MGFWKTFWACLLAVVISSFASILFSFMIFAAMIASLTSFEGQVVSITKNSVLMVDLGAQFKESAESKFNPSELFGATTEKITTYDAVRLIERAAVDPLVDGIYVKVPLVIPSSMASLYELREALIKFKAEAPNKFIVAYGDGYSQGALYLSSVCDTVCLNPTGGVDWKGMSATVMFFKGSMDKLGVEPEIFRHGSFKGAVEPFMLDKMSDDNRLQYQQLLSSMWNYMVGNIASCRGLDSTALQSVASDLSALDAKGALKAGLVDKLCYRDELIGQLKELTGSDAPNLITLSDYKYSTVINRVSDNKVALIYAQGDIVDIASNNGFGQSSSIVGNDLAATIRSAREDESVKAIVLRVNSPGGSVLASDIIYREVFLARNVKPVVISMGEYAASGGYWISAPSDAIVASPMTITGSIGVFGLMFNVEKGAREKLGVTTDVVSTNPSADLGSMFRGMSPLERTVMQSSVDSIYTRFVTLVATGRNMSYDSVDAIASGRVWSGLQALDNGLVNKLGTLNDAIELAAQKAGVENNYAVSVYSDAPKSFVDILLGGMQGLVVRIMGEQSVVATEAQKLENLLKKQGVQAIMPHQIELQK